MDHATPPPPWPGSPGPEDPPFTGAWRGGSFSAGRVLSQSFAALAKSPVFYYTLSLLASLPGLLLKMANASGAILQSAVDIFFSVIFTGAIAYGVYQNLIGNKVGLIQALRKGLSRYLSLVGVTFLCSVILPIVVFGVILAAAMTPLLVVVPFAAFLYIVVLFFVAVPACVVEGVGPLTSLERSVNLTWKCRGSIVGLLIVYGVIAVAGRLGQAALFGKASAQVGISDFGLSPFLLALYQIITVTTYYQLRVAKEGVGIDRLATVFD